MSSEINPKLRTPKNMNSGKTVFLRNLDRLSMCSKSIIKYLENYFGFGSEEDKQ